MRFGIFGDIHSNLEALEAVLEDMQAQAVTHTVCIGDIVGYLRSIQFQCRSIHEMIYELYVDYSIQAALAGLLSRLGGR